MKKICLLKSIFIILSVICFICSCKNKKSDIKINDVVYETTRELQELNGKSINSQNEILVVVFSFNDTVRELGYIIKDYLFTDIVEITPEIAYTKDDLDLTNINSKIKKEFDDINARPAIINRLKNLDKYKYIFLGFPMWDNKVPKIIYTFLEKYNFDGKIILPFSSYDSNEFDIEELKEIVKGSATFYPIEYLGDGVKISKLLSWIQSLDFDFKIDSSLIDDEEPIIKETEIENIFSDSIN